MSIIGKCPYCKDGNIILSKKDVLGKSTKIYTCSNASWTSEDGEMFELTKESTCSFRIWGNSLLKWGKRGIGVYEVKKLLKGEDVPVRMYSFTSKKEYYKYITLDYEYGVSVIWDIDIKEEDLNISA
jgi:hypothetical protein